MNLGRCRGERGVVLAEFALIVPFLALMTFATIDLGRVYTLQHRLANGAREGAVFAQYFPWHVSNASGAAVCADPDNVKYHALNEDRGTTSGFTVKVTNVATGAEITDACTAPGPAVGTTIKVTVTGDFTPLTFFAKQFIGSPAKIRESAVVVVQG
ncbi:MAG: pilus assembly protein [Actinobacteria bacterium]|nr:pilus assembly protein [Actinomycetota bacterium]